MQRLTEVIEFTATATISILTIAFCFYILGALAYFTYQLFKITIYERIRDFMARHPRQKN